jgi:hypothetical protein
MPIKTNTDKAPKAAIQGDSITYHFRFPSFSRLINGTCLMSVVMGYVLVILAFLGDIPWLGYIGVLSIPMTCVAGAAYCLLFYRHLTVTLTDTNISRHSLFAVKKINLKDVKDLILYDYSYPLWHPLSTCPDILVHTRHSLKIASDDEAFCLSDNMIDFDEFVNNISQVTKLHLKFVSETRAGEIFKF